ncbi:MAG: hypothetical protein HY698_20650 [Deltaproteobacteria bacterium]|nr:hypothetical protein [Deltaproteobacteria bacterium]
MKLTVSKLHLATILPAALGLSSACTEETDSPEIRGQGQGIAIINSDYTSTSISLLDPATGTLARDDCMNSGTKPPAPSLALSGDVVLPSQPQEGHELLAIDRGNSALTWIDPTACTPSRQLAVGTGFFANPHEVVSISATKAYVTRYERNESPTDDKTDFDEGSDILIINPTTPAITGRIDLGSYAVKVEGAEIQARPDRAIRANGKVYVALANLSADYKAAGHGRIVVVDTEKDAVEGTIDIPGLKGCGGLHYLEAQKSLLVSCGGSFSDGEKQADGAGIVTIDLGARTPAITKTLRVTPFGGRVVTGFEVQSMSDELGFTVTFGSFSGPPPDTFWSFNPRAGTAEKLFDANGGFVLGAFRVDTKRNKVYLADGSKNEPRIHVFEAKPGQAVVKTGAVVPNPARGLPPRDLAWY